MDLTRKRYRGDASEAAAKVSEDECAAISGCGAQYAHSSKRVTSSTSAEEVGFEGDSDYTVLVKRSSALLAKFGQRNALNNCTTEETGSTSKESTQPMKLQCAIEKPEPSSHSVSCVTGSVIVPFATLQDTLPAELISHSTKFTQTDSSISLDARKNLLSTELSELHALLHVFFS
ncbi:hypothetical protein JKF63_00578 [Porcisia hertigi]|uniref:Uncharacterized protein n=1 Tax=Porcisia hertigi TaxID=2761500 RepID=A0A836HZB5_9TRYP|nr:hypothetical protein JKF63_00578 [Porcisia hertigi]